jgi:hypothetical protein
MRGDMVACNFSANSSDMVVGKIVSDVMRARAE